MVSRGNITADAVALQERDEFRELGWVKVLSPAKVNLHLAIGERRADGYHNAATVMHALNLHDMVYARVSEKGAAASETTCRMVSGDSTIGLPEIAPEDNLAVRAVARLAVELGEPAASLPALELRIEKSIPAQAGLGGGSSNAAAALVAAARLWGIPHDDPRIEQAARALGADVAFFLHGGCAYLEGTGDEFVHALSPSQRSVVIVKPEGGVSTAAAYRAFDEAPTFVSPEQAEQVAIAKNADDIALFNNLAPASETLMPELAEVHTWLDAQPGTRGALLCGSGAATFALCDGFSSAAAIVSEARKRGWWTRATALGSSRVAAAGAGAGAEAAGASTGERA